VSLNLTEWDIAVADLATGTHSVLVRGVRARYAASGHLLYVTADGTLMAVPFDETTLSLTGDAVALVEGLRVRAFGTIDLAISATGTLFYMTGGVGEGGLAEVVWVTRDGTAEEIHPGWTEDFWTPRLSPDGTRLAVPIHANDEQQIWIKELDRGPLPKLTFTGSRNDRPAWTPDGRFVAFGSDRGGDLDLYMRSGDGTRQAELLLDEEERLGEVTFSPDGEWLVYRRNSGGRDLYARRIGVDMGVDSVPVPLVTTEFSETLYARRIGVDMGVDSVPVPLVTTEFSETTPAVSPDGRWLAYASNESGQYEVYVRPFPNTNDGKWQVSTNHGTEPVWAHSGRELFYKGSGDLMVVEVLPGATFVTGERRVLFSTQGYRSRFTHQFYDVTADDQRFVMIRNRGAEEVGELIVVENFFEDLKAKVGN
jgi:serine/threonine-protein kinase